MLCAKDAKGKREKRNALFPRRSACVSCAVVMRDDGERVRGGVCVVTPSYRKILERLANFDFFPLASNNVAPYFQRITVFKMKPKLSIYLYLKPSCSCISNITILENRQKIYTLMLRIESLIYDAHIQSKLE